MPKKSRRHSTAREAYWFVEEFERERDEISNLWVRVLYQALADATFLKNKNVTKRNVAIEAIYWLLKADSEIEAICENADMNSDWFISSSREWLRANYSEALLLGVIAHHENWGAKRLKLKETEKCH
mgnify:FL=1